MKIVELIKKQVRGRWGSFSRWVVDAPEFRRDLSYLMISHPKEGKAVISPGGLYSPDQQATVEVTNPQLWEAKGIQLERVNANCLHLTVGGRTFKIEGRFWYDFDADFTQDWVPYTSVLTVK